MVGSGDRSERIRTYNFPQGRVTDHRINLTLHRLPEILEGQLDELIDALIAEDEAERLASLDEQSASRRSAATPRAARLARRSSDDAPRLDAELLMAHALGVDARGRCCCGSSTQPAPGRLRRRCSRAASRTSRSPISPAAAPSGRSSSRSAPAC